jgi:hypothetical protein
VRPRVQAPVLQKKERKEKRISSAVENRLEADTSGKGLCGRKQKEEI